VITFTLRGLENLQSVEFGMGDNFGSGKSSNKATIGVHAGLKSRAAKWPDASINPSKTAGISPKGVGSDSTRSSVAATPKTLGPRTA
jgi:hypothetical protein